MNGQNTECTETERAVSHHDVCGKELPFNAFSGTPAWVRGAQRENCGTDWRPEAAHAQLNPPTRCA